MKSRFFKNSVKSGFPPGIKNFPFPEMLPVPVTGPLRINESSEESSKLLSIDLL
jgi:hypothetical protein